MKGQYLKAKDKVDRREAPDGFFAVSKDRATTANACASCDARNLCQKNEDNWCLKNRCMSYLIVAADGTEHQRRDKQSVIFKRRRVA